VAQAVCSCRAAIHAAQLEFKVMFGAVGEIIQFVFIGIDGARSDFVQQGLPDMGKAAVNENDLCLAAFSGFFSEGCRQFQSARSTADNNYPMSL